MGWLFLPLKRYADFRGRSRRREFWTWMLFVWLVSTMLAAVDRGGSLSALFSLATFVPTLAVAVRRLHDTGRRGSWLLLPFVAMVAVGTIAGILPGHVATFALLGLALLGSMIGPVILLCLNGTAGANRFGPDPRQPESHWADVFG